MADASPTTVQSGNQDSDDSTNTGWWDGDDDRTDLPIGAVVIDEADPTGDEAVVINRPDTTVDDWYAYNDVTVAEDNPDYPSDDRVAVVAFREELFDEHPRFNGVSPLFLENVDVSYYSFPESRLTQVGEISEREVSVERFRPSPYHSRNFTVSENEEFVASIRENGGPDPYPLVRAGPGNTFEILNGHKRVWAATVAGLDTIPYQFAPVDDWSAAKIFASAHVKGADWGPEREAATEKLIARWGDRAGDIPGIRPQDVE